jgi:hypothetical protein
MPYYSFVTIRCEGVAEEHDNETRADSPSIALDLVRQQTSKKRKKQTQKRKTPC